jgi:hypothetical protein
MAALLPSNPPVSNRPATVEQLVELIAPALGREKSRELILASAKSLGHAPDRLNLQQALAILGALGEDPGIVGISARFAKTRLVAPGKKQAPSAAQPSSTARSLAPVESAPASAASQIEPDELAALLAHSIGTEKSKEVVRTALSALGLAGGGLNADQAHAILEAIAKTDGIVGVTARFAKARLLLRLKRQ